LPPRAPPRLDSVVGKEKVQTIRLQPTAEDSAHYARRVSSFFFWVGVTPPARDPATAPFNHSPLFYVDEAGLGVGLRALLALAIDRLERPAPGAVRPGP